MADRYIDNGETQIYGPYLRERLETIRDLDPIVPRLIDGQAEADARMAAALREVTSADGDIELAIDARGPIGIEVVNAMNAFHDQLRAWSQVARVRVSIEEFFKDGTKTGAGRTPAQRRVALRRVLDGIARYDLPEKDEWAQRFDDLYKRLDEVVKTADAATGSRKPATEALADARRAWLRHYRATKHIVEGLLLLTSREAETRSFFKDRQVSPRRVESEVVEAAGMGE